MENNQSGQAQDGMADQRFRSWLTEQLNMQQQNAGCSSNPAPAVMQMPALPSHTDYGGIYPNPTEYDGYNWRMCGQKLVQGGCHQKFYYECSQANCGAEKSVTRSADGQIKKTVCKGSHNHPRSSERVFGDGSATLDAILVGEILQAAGVIRPSVAMPRNEEEDGLQSGSSDSGDDDASEARAAGDDNAIRHVPAAAAQDTTAHNTIDVDVLGNSSQQRKNYHRSEKRKSKSKVWEDFTAVFSGGKVQSAECKHCKKCLSGKTSGGTSHLRRHLKICPAQFRTTRLQQEGSSSILDSSAANNRKFDQETSLELLIRGLVSNHCSYLVPSSANFRQFLVAICPDYNMVPQAAFEEKFLSFFHNEKMKLKEKIELTPGGVFLSVTKQYVEFKTFVCITVHFIDNEWKMNRKIISYGYGGYPDGADYYVGILTNWKSYLDIRDSLDYNFEEIDSSLIKEAVQDWNLEHKLLGLALHKNFRNNVTSDLEECMAGEVQNYLLAKYKLLTVPCMIDALHDFFGYDVGNFVKEISKEWFEYMTCSALCLEKYKEILSRMHLNKPSLGSQKWHLTFYLFEAALQFNKEFPNPEEMDSQMDIRKPSPQRLEATKNFCDLVRPIYHAIDLLSRQYVTSNSHFHALWRVGIALGESSRKLNMKCIINVDYMKKRFDILWRKCYVWLSLAVFLDPRFKLRYLEQCFTQVSSSGCAKLFVLEVRAKIYELFLQYSCNVDWQTGELLNHRSNDLQMDRHGNDSLHGTDKNDIEQGSNGEFRELTSYIEGELYPQNDQFDILKWWKDNASTYPTLARLARDILAIPGSAVSAEYAFNKTGERVILFNQKMSPEIVEALICTQDWIKSSETGDKNGGS
nr:zinc finger BED domain-containing protein RICESLEEPER 1-like [Oryza sativa Japonica Group]XP_015649133.1 zinc finger BED domain-containing protein RICESLEEPER 1-like [Oryza sativa Japonica Group]